jgi:hypothetical protein
MSTTEIVVCVGEEDEGDIMRTDRAGGQREGERACRRSREDSREDRESWKDRDGGMNKESGEDRECWENRESRGGGGG